MEEAKMNKSFLAFSFLVLAVSAFAKDIPAKPNPPKLVNDYANALSSEQNNALERKLVAYFDSTSTQIAVVIENSLDGDDLFDYCQRLAIAWGIGEKGKNNGLLIYVAVKDHKVRIHTGYGMEATITDALTAQIRLEQISPNFKQGNYYEGLDQATNIIMRAAAGEYVGNGSGLKKKIPGGFSKFFLFFIIIMVLMAIFRGRGGRGGGLMGPIFFGTFGSGGFSSGGGGGDGGGFGGFGGGGFGGGGSGGDW